MAEMTPQERLLPFLLDRLVDEDPQNKLESRERRVISFKQFHKAILRDLQWLLNSPTKAAVDEIDEFPEVAKSVLNYGMPDIAGSTESSMTPEMVEKMVRTAVHTFEPRVLRNSLHVRGISAAKAVGNMLALEIRGQVWAQPMPESLYVKTEVDLETGMCKLQDQLHG
jgi:type VI secretion system protein ImpF